MRNKIIRMITVIATAILIASTTAGCASSSKIRSDYDRTTDFSQYQSYNFYDDAGPETTNYQNLFSQYMTSAISREMEALGYVKSDDPDLLVNFNAILQDKTKVTTRPSSVSYGGYYGYRHGFYDPWYGYSHSRATEVHVSEYTEGTVNIDVVDTKTKKLVWEAVSVGRVREKTLQNIEQAVMDAVPRFFATYPIAVDQADQ